MSSSEETALGVHRKYGSNQAVVEHCRAVARVARMLAEEFVRKGHPVDVSAVTTAALLHDVGRSKTQTVRHGVDGADLAEKEGYERKVVEIVRRHVGAGISREEAERLGFPDFDYIPRTLEERIVCFADKMVDGTRVRPFEEEVRRFVLKSHDVSRLRSLKDELGKELGEDPERVVFEKLKESH